MISYAILAAAEPVMEHESVFSPTNPEFWVYAGITIFLACAIFLFKFPKLIAEALDKRIAETRRQLDEARTIRAEAEQLLAEAKARQAASHKDAEAIIAQATLEAQELVEDMENAATDLIGRRQKMAEDKIAIAERGAIAEVRARVATAATAAATTLITKSHNAKADKGLIDETIGKLAH